MLQALEAKSLDDPLVLFDAKPTEHVSMLLRVMESINKEDALRALLALISLFFKGFCFCLFACWFVGDFVSVSAGRTRQFLKVGETSPKQLWAPLEKLQKK